jgi:hypothetical protein
MTFKHSSVIALTDEFITQWPTFIASEYEKQPWLGEDLLQLLGCSYVHYRGHVSLLLTPEDTVMAPRDEIVECLPKLLDLVINNYGVQSTNISSLMTGICRNELLTHFLSNEHHAYSLAIGVLLYIEMYEANYMLDCAAAPNVVSILNEWVNPSDPWSELPGAVALACHLFGDAWADLLLQQSEYHEVGGCSQYGPLDVDKGYVMVGLLVAQTRPPFIDGLCPELQIDYAVQLPAM